MVEFDIYVYINIYVKNIFYFNIKHKLIDK